MFKKIAVALMALIMILQLNFFVIAEEEDVVVIHDCNSSFGTFRVNKDSERGNCLALEFHAGMKDFANQCSFTRPIDAEGMDTLAMELYLSDPEMLRHIQQLYIEITSSGTCDKEENAWPAQMLLNPNKLQPGWNTVYFYLNDSAETQGKCDLSAINYIRIFGFLDGAALEGEILKIDDIRMIYTGGYDYADLDMDFYRGDNLDVDITIKGQEKPDLTHRHDHITMIGGKK